MAALPIKKMFIIAIMACAGVFGVVKYAANSGNLPAFSGYAVADTIYVAVPNSGQIAAMHVVKGQQVQEGNALFALYNTDITTRLLQTDASIKQHSAQIMYEQAILEQLQENLAIAATEQKRTEQDLTRYVTIAARNRGAISQIDIDHARLAATTATLQRAAVAKEIEGAHANISAAQQKLVSAQAEKTRLEREQQELAPTSPVAGYIEDIYTHKGEWATANKPVLGIVPLDGIKIRFFVPEQNLEDYAPGTKVIATTTSGQHSYEAVVSFIDTKPEFTPPVIYSLESRHKMVFCVEAVPVRQQGILPGMPLDVTRKQQAASFTPSTGGR